MQNKKKSLKKILIIEDEMLHQKIFQNLLGKFYLIIIAESLEEASALLISDSPDMMVMDIHIDGYDGRSCIEYPNLSIPVLATSSSITMSANQFRELGFSGFIRKPAAAKVLLSTIEEGFLNTRKEPIPEDLSAILNLEVIKDLLKFNPPTKLEEIFYSFIKETECILNEFETGVFDNNQELFADKMHIIKGNSGTLGADRIYHLSSKAEEFARKNRPKDALNLLPELEKEILSLRTTLDKTQIFEK